MNKFVFLALDRTLCELEVTTAREGVFGFGPIPKKIRMSGATMEIFLPSTQTSIDLCKQTFVIQHILFEIDDSIPYGKVFVRWGRPA